MAWQVEVTAAKSDNLSSVLRNPLHHHHHTHRTKCNLKFHYIYLFVCVWMCMSVDVLQRSEDNSQESVLFPLPRGSQGSNPGN